MTLRQGLAAAAVAVAAGGAMVGVHPTGHRASITEAAPLAAVPAADLPASPRPALHVATPRLLDDRNASMWASVVHAVAARQEPEAAAHTVDFVGRKTPEGTANIVLVLSERVVDGKTWCKVSLPSTSGARAGWIPRSALGALHIADTRLDVDLTRLRLTLRIGGVPVLRAPIGVGRPQTPTSTGEFYVRDKLTRYDSPFYGPIAFGTSARSRVLTDWPAGGYIGIHGTNQPELIPGRVSHGCIRLRNADLLRLARLLPVGTPITIHTE